MVLPLVPVVAALTGGGSLVAHSAGGLIVYSSVAGGYVAGTYVSTAALASFLTGSAVAAGAVGTAAVSGTAIWAYGTATGAAMSLVGSAGLFGTTVGATGITGLMMRTGLLSSVSIFVPIFVVSALILMIVSGAYYAVKVRRLRSKVLQTPNGEEAIFTKWEAKLVEKIMRSAAKSHSFLWKTLMKFMGKKSAPA